MLSCCMLTFPQDLNLIHITRDMPSMMDVRAGSTESPHARTGKDNLYVMMGGSGAAALLTASTV